MTMVKVLKLFKRATWKVSSTVFFDHRLQMDAA